MHLKKALVVILLLACCSSFAQTVTRDREYGLNLGFSSFLGDLGGSDAVGRAFWWDIDPEVTRPALGFIFRVETYPNVAIRYNVYYSVVRGADSLTNNEFRHYRNLSFKSPILEGSVMVELGLFRFTGPRAKKFTPYLYGGLGGFWFNPQAQYNGTWYELQPLGTEGQGLPEYPYKDKYRRIGFCFPVGAGFRYNIVKQWVFGFEMATRFTNTDYIDDVSGCYPNPDYFFEHYDPETAIVASALSNPSDGSRPDLVELEGGRGDPTDNDTYVFGGLFTLTYHFTVTKRPKIGKCFFSWDKKE